MNMKNNLMIIFLFCTYNLLGDYMKYTVKAGDTLWGISNQYGVSVTELAELNKVDASTLKVGMILTIPNSSGSNPDNMFMYKVVKGDSLYSIAKRYGTSVEEIKKLNYLTSNNLVIGQVLRIPEMYTKPSDMVLPNYVNYKVVKGDTLYSIAKKFNVSVDSIINDNNLKNNTLSIGQNLKIRSNEVEECFGEDISYNTYTVVKGDSLYSIARKFNVSVDYLKKLNNLTSNLLSVGQILKI